jgi:hypothetical protein
MQSKQGKAWQVRPTRTPFRVMVIGSSEMRWALLNGNYPTSRCAK